MNNNLSPTQFPSQDVSVFKLKEGDVLARNRHTVARVGEKRRTPYGFRHWVTIKRPDGTHYKREWSTWAQISVHRPE